MYEDILEQAGLSRAESKVYLALLRLGAAQIGEVRKQAGLQHSVAHLVLERLEEKGAVGFVMESNTRVFHANGPGILLNQLTQKIEGLKAVIPDLERLRDTAPDTPIATLHRGVRSMRQLWRGVLETDEYLAYGGSRKSHELLGDFFWKGLHRERIERKVKARMIFHTSLKRRGSEIRKEPNIVLRFTSRDFEGLSETLIFGDMVVTFVYLDEPYAFVIRQKEAARSQRKFFEILWKQAK